MKRTPLARKAPLARSGPLRRRRKPPVHDPRRDEFKRVRDGICRVCGARGLVRRHHVIREQHVRREGGDPWALANSLWIGVEDLTCRCHSRQHDAFKRIPLAVVPDRAIEFACDLLGAWAEDYFTRDYDVRPGEWKSRTERRA